MPIFGDPLDGPIDVNTVLGIGCGSKPDDVAAVSLNESRTWREMDVMSQRLATGYLDVGLKAGDRVASLAPNRIALLIHYLACLKAGLVAVPLNYRYTGAEIDYALDKVGAKLLFAHVERAKDLYASDCVQRLPFGVVRLEETGSQSSRAGLSYERLVDPANDARDIGPHRPDAVAAVFFTSGSTGKPKGVAHSRRTLGWLMASYAATYNITADDTIMPATSWSHIGGYGISLMGLAQGARISVARSITDEEILPLLRKARPTFLKMLPAAMFALVHDHDATRDDFASLRLCIAGGDRISLELERAFIDLAGLEISELYGMTETGVSCLNAPGPGSRIGSVGTPCAGYALSIRDDAGNELPENAEGSLWVRFRGNFLGYWNDPAATRAIVAGDWVNTGDVLMRDSDGYLWFRGRKKQIIVHDGSNISPLEVEETIETHPAVEQACAIGVHDAIHGENVRAYVTLREDTEPPTGSELIKLAQEKIGYKAPEEIVFLAEMPITVTGKIDRKRLMRQALEHRDA